MSLFFMQMTLYYIHNQHRQLNLLSDNFYRVVDIPAPEQFPCKRLRDSILLSLSASSTFASLT